MNMQQFVGKTLDQAQKMAKDAGFVVRVANQGIQTLSNDFVVGRVNFRVENGIVVSAQMG